MTTESDQIRAEIQNEFKRLKSEDDSEFPYMRIRATLLCALATIQVAEEIRSVVNNLKILDSIRQKTNLD
jgi:hypothetical protein